MFDQNQNGNLPVVMNNIPQPNYYYTPVVTQYDYERAWFEEYKYERKLCLKTQAKQRDNFLLMQQRIKNYEIVEKNNNIWLQKLDGNKQILSESIVFNCYIKNVKRYICKETQQEFFQLVITERNGESISCLYGVELLSSHLKLQQTILCKYISVDGLKAESYIWKWALLKVINLFDLAEIQYIPALPGWYENEGTYCFWRQCKKLEMLSNTEIKNFNLRYLEKQGAETVKSLFCNTKSFEIKEIGILLIVRLIALLGRLCTEESISLGVILYGDTAMTVARKLLSVSEDENNIFNLDTDRINTIRLKAKKMRENTMIFVLTDPDNKSTQNRIKEIFSWYRSGYIESSKVTVPYIFCMNTLSTHIPLENCIILDADLVKSSEWEKPFTALQSYWVDLIESSGVYKVERLQSYMGKGEMSSKQKLKALNNCIVKETVMSLQSENEKEDGVKKLLEIGKEALERQIEEHEKPVELFRSMVLQSADRRDIDFCRYKDIMTEYKSNIVYYDEKYYYFTKNILQKICEKGKMDSKSLLMIKQQLISMGVVKLYRNTGNHSRELQIDITIRNTSKANNTLSVFAIQRSFWDELGKICLYERGK